jgi:hypothetical protein
VLAGGGYYYYITYVLPPTEDAIELTGDEIVNPVHDGDDDDDAEDDDNANDESGSNLSDP